MPNRAWWLWLVTASFVAYWILLYSSLYFVRAPLGFNIERPDNGAVIAGINPGSAAQRAGMRAGDRIVGAIGLPVVDQVDWMTVGANVPIGAPSEWIVERNGTHVTLTVPPLSRRWVLPSSRYVVIMISQLISLALGLLLFWRGDGRRTTMLAAWLLCSIGCVTLPIWPRSMATEVRAMPMIVQAVFWPAAITSTAAPALLFAFCALFPQPLLRPRLLAMVMLPIVAVVTLVDVVSVLIVYDPLAATRVPMPLWLSIIGPLSYAAYFMAGAVLVFVSLRRARDPNDRRRVQVLVTGIFAGALGLFTIAGDFTALVEVPELIRTAGGMAFAVLPIAFAYATLRHQLFDLRIIIRLGLQYALARGAIGAVVPITLLVLVGDVLLHRGDTLESIVYERGVAYITVLLVVFLVYGRRHEWMDAIDRRFFRDRYAAQQILKEVVQDVGASPSFDAAAQKVIVRVDSALHPVMAAVMTKPRTSTAFSAIASTGAKTPPLPSDGPIAQVARALGKPVTTAALGIAGDVDLVVPIAIEAYDDDALLVLGPRRSEEPYSNEDKELLAAIAASLRLLMGRKTTPVDLPTVTAVSPMPAIANRYRIERPIGEGGMGVVFAATDERLERPVAIKVIKDEHLKRGDGLARFEREARTAASLSHPNIVTVHDFGIDESGSPYLVMELLHGRSLRTAIKNDGKMPESKAIAILGGLASAIDTAHAKGVIHRDLKPENIFLTSDTHAKILDYGIAKFMGASGASGASGATGLTTAGILGTLAYMAPEQASGAPASPAWDVWALSVIAFEMLTGQHPFGGGLPVARAIPIRTLAPDLEEALANVINQALSLAPEDRPNTAAQFIHSMRS